MPRRVHVITHPDVVVDRNVPVPLWPLSERGRRRMQAGVESQPWVRAVTAVYCSGERKAVDGAQILAGHLGLSHKEIAALGENDRSATGFLPPDEFERTADRFFAEPDASVRGWETARDAQRRIVTAVTRLIADDTSQGDIAVVTHGAVGTLLYCHLAGRPIDRRFDQPANGGGNFLSFDLADPAGITHWRRFDEVEATAG